MAYNIHYKTSVEKDIKSISKEELSKILDKIESELSVNPFAYPKLKGEFKSLRKFRIGKYRIIYTISGKEVIIAKIGHRKDIYR
ncbi:MAG TPA: type II toxin-antitoxin system RelE/ParE family toxin [Ignavibacteria bacterium]|nr:type II toxin-antitoxin system RelE/ParE family toxin [Ignavibacteria bacterium]